VLTRFIVLKVGINPLLFIILAPRSPCCSPCCSPCLRCSLSCSQWYSLRRSRCFQTTSCPPPSQQDEWSFSATAKRIVWVSDKHEWPIPPVAHLSSSLRLVNKCNSVLRDVNENWDHYCGCPRPARRDILTHQKLPYKNAHELRQSAHTA